MAITASTTATSSETGSRTGSSWSGHPALKEREIETALIYLFCLTGSLDDHIEFVPSPETKYLDPVT